jgi:p-aminobenzoyl-glutamate transporter AbgT
MADDKKSLDVRKTKRLNRSILSCGIVSAIAVLVVWLHISRGPFWHSLIAAIVVFFIYCNWAYDVTGQIKRSEYLDDVEQYWNAVERVLFTFNSTMFLTALGVSFLILLARNV